MLVIACGLAHGARRSIYASLGILGANALYFAISATALGAVLVASSEFFIAVKWAGAAYLVYVGLSALFGRPSPITVSNAGARSLAPRDLFLAGLTLQLANPKTLIFFVAILPQFVDARLPVGPQMAVARGRLDRSGVLHPRRLRLPRIAGRARGERCPVCTVDRSRRGPARAVRRSAGHHRVPVKCSTRVEPGSRPR